MSSIDEVRRRYARAVNSSDLATIVEDLRVEGSDVSDVEVKRASGGVPESLASTMSAFANTPGGGTIVLGLDEHDNFRSVGVSDPATVQAGIASKARSALEPPVTFDSGVLTFEGSQIVWARIHELDPSMKPCHVKNGPAYLRAYDGDYAIAPTEEQAFLANRTAPVFDRQSVAEASRSDLDEGLVAAFIRQAKTTSSALARFEDDELLRRTGVMAVDGHPTLAGLLSLGAYPQQFFPQLVIQASVTPPSGAAARSLDVRKFDGPIPTMLDDALQWVQRNTRTRIRFGESGDGRDEPEYPVEAIRELLSNALVHRDLGPHALGKPIELRLLPDRIVLANPGGLFGITKAQLGKQPISSTRNALLARICQNVRTPRDARVVELLSDGIRIVLEKVRGAGMVPPQFHDQAVRFTVVMPNHALLSRDELEWLTGLPDSASLSDTQRHALVAMRGGIQWNNRTLRESFPMDSAEARHLLKDLVDRGLAKAVGEKKWRVYELASPTVVGSAVDSSLAPIPRTEEGAQYAAPKERVREALAAGPRSARELTEALGLSRKQVTYALTQLRDDQEVTIVGTRGRGPGTRWSLARIGESPRGDGSK